jgi:signal transduction histidine kinase
MGTLILVTVIGLGLWQAIWSAGQRQNQIELKVGQVVRTIASSNFPLTSKVLEQMKGLAGAEFVLTNESGRVVVSTDQRLEPLLSKENQPGVIESGQPIEFNKQIQLEDQQLYWTKLALPERGADATSRWLHIFYSATDVGRQRWQAMWPTVLFGVLSLLVATGLAAVIASRVTRPLEQLQTQVERISRGEFQPVNLPVRQDEVHKLSEAVNRMASMLSDYEAQIRQTERFRMLGQLGGGLAHQLRNSATGARLAIDLHRETCELPGGHESLEVAIRQLVLMEKYLQKFMTLGTSSSEDRQPVDLSSLIRNLRSLVQPFAKHAHVELEFQLPDQPVVLLGDSDGLEHMVLNLVLNGIHAAGEIHSDQADENGVRLVAVRLACVARSRGQLVVADSGVGPPVERTFDLLDPFVTGKRDGVGLGLSVVQNVAKDHGGSVCWRRVANRTEFVVELPLDDPAAFRLASEATP